MNAITNDGLVRELRRAIAAAGDLWTLADLVELAREGRIQVWHDGGAVVMTDVVDFPRKRIVRVFLVAGRMAGVRRLARQVEAFAVASEADAMVAEGRAAWERIGAPMGWQPRAVAYVKTLAKPEAANA